MVKKYSRAEVKQIGKIAWEILDAWTNANKEHIKNFDAVKYFEKTQQASDEAFKLAQKFYKLSQDLNNN